MVTTQLLSKDFFLAGDEVEGYRLLEIIGGGGEGSVWSAWDSENERIVALKFTNNDPKDSQFAAKKARLGDLVELDHPHIREIFRAGSLPTMDFMAMRYYPSGSVGNLIKSRTLSPENVLFIAAQVVSALDFIHRRGIVHRDLKPTNVLLNSDLRAFLTDFGIAKELSQSTVALHTGQGTPAYSSPEQHTRAPVNLKTDIYSFGIMLFEMFAGDLPWKGFTALAMKQLDTGEELPDPRSENPALPTGLHQALMRLTAANPERRPNTMVEAFQLVLDAWYPEPLDGLKSAGERLLYNQLLARIPKSVGQTRENLNEARNLLKRKIRDWKRAEDPANPRLTEYLFLNLVFSKPEYFSTLSSEERDFMVYVSVLHGRNMAFWWGKSGDAEEKLALSAQIFEKEAGEPVVRIMKLLLLEPEIFSPGGEISGKLIRPLMAQLDGVNPPEVIENALILLQSLIPDQEKWQEVAFSPALDKSLAQLAFSEEYFSRQAIALIAQIKSLTSLDEILARDGDSLGVLGAIREQTGKLPGSVGSGIRTRVFGRLAWSQLSGDWGSALRVFLAAALAVGLGLGVHVFVSIRLPGYLDASRFLNSIGSGLLFGPIVGLGIFLNRWLVQRLRVMGKFSRMGLGILLGGLVVNLGFVAYHYLFLSASISGVWVLAGSIIFSAGFSLGDGLELDLWLRMVLATLFIGLALGITYELARVSGTSPMLYYERDEVLQMIFLVLVFSGIVGVVSQLFKQTSTEVELF